MRSKAPDREIPEIKEGTPELPGQALGVATGHDCQGNAHYGVKWALDSRQGKRFRCAPNNLGG